MELGLAWLGSVRVCRELFDQAAAGATPLVAAEALTPFRAKMKIALLTTDSREVLKNYSSSVLEFGTAPEALMQGFALMPEVEVHVVSCAQAKMNSPEKVAPNVFFHSLYVPKGCNRAVRSKLKELQPDVVHGQGTERDCAISAVFSGFPNVLTIHGNMRQIARVNRVRPFSFLWLAARLERLTIPRSGGVVCITDYTRQAVKDLARRTWVVPNAVDASFFEVKAQPAVRWTLWPGGTSSSCDFAEELTSATLTVGNSSVWSRRAPGAFTMDWPTGQSSKRSWARQRCWCCPR